MKEHRTKSVTPRKLKHAAQVVVELVQPIVAAGSKLDE